VNERIKNILNKLIQNGYEAYLVGGYVRDYIIGNSTFDIDIATNALPKDVIRIFDLSIDTKDNYGSVSFKDDLYNYEITTFRCDISYNNRLPIIEYTNDVKVDVKRRDFTINSLYMDINSKIIDELNGIDDINNKIIRCIGNVDKKMEEDPLRMLRAIRFATILDFELEKDLFNYIKTNNKLITTLSTTRKKEELDKIFSSKNAIKGIRLIKDLNLEDTLNIKINKVLPSSNYLGIWSQIEVLDDYPFSNQELDVINQVKKVLMCGIIDSNVLYKYGLYISVISGEILGLEQSTISESYKNLPIYSPKDIKIDGNDIMYLLNIKPSKKISKIINDLESNIINGNLNNNYEELKSYILKKWK
jgi:tRNA nucleotidyltransferase (CCA-adding enzyme)